MADLKSKLARLSSPYIRRPPLQTPPVAAVKLSDGEGPWELREVDGGVLHVMRCQYEASQAHGRMLVSACQQVQAKHVALLALCNSWHHVDLRRLLFLDTETTGLAGGAGTLPFLVGLGYFTAKGFCTEQLFLRRPGEEAPVLRHLASQLAAASAIVTYNGKSFDWPLLKMRYVMNRVAMPQVPQHLDLLHCVRRIYKRRQTPLRLVNLERELLAFCRVGDIDGAAIPALYFAYLRGAHVDTLTPIFEHNALDLVAMAAILGALGRILEAPDTCTQFAERLCIAELTLRAGQENVAHQLVASAVDSASGTPPAPYVPSHHHAEAHLLLARLRRRRGDHSGCVEALHRAVAACAGHPDQAARIHLALAKLYEHRLANPALAQHHATLALGSETAEAAMRRGARLARKAARAGEQAVRRVG